MSGNFKKTMSAYKKYVIVLLSLFVVFMGIFIVLKLTLSDTGMSGIFKRFFNQPQWSHYNFSSAIGKMSISPVVNDMNLDAIRKACGKIGIEQPVLPTDRDISRLHTPKYIHARFYEKLSNAQGYELRFFIFIDLADDQVYSQWIAALPCVIDSEGGFLNIPEGEMIYSADAEVAVISADMRAFFEKAEKNARTK
ncbi:MAG: hypothetical protein LBF64_04410 [Oscillospiraceae bacterium]|jgi:hypothetical protein|nr:hypothetical protein [Oscillospiraceae bacterium]